jgi:hypothetical protein
LGAFLDKLSNDVNSISNGFNGTLGFSLSLVEIRLVLFSLVMSVFNFRFKGSDLRFEFSLLGLVVSDSLGESDDVLVSNIDGVVGIINNSVESSVL